jgi:hypothetical protein
VEGADMIDEQYEQWRETVNELFAACVKADAIPAESVLTWFRQAVEDDNAYHANARQPVRLTHPFGIKRTGSIAPTRRFT